MKKDVEGIHERILSRPPQVNWPSVFYHCKKKKKKRLRSFWQMNDQIYKMNFIS